MKLLTGLAVGGCGLFCAITAYKVVIVNNMRWFAASEFGASLPFLAVGLLEKLDQFRGVLGCRVIVSPAPGALMRFDKGSESQHNFGRAADIMLPDGPDLMTAVDAAKSVGFTGIGAYPAWKPYPGLHLDIRPGDRVATWGAIKKDGQQIYVSMEAALNESNFNQAG